MQERRAAQVVGERFAEPAAVLGGTGNDGVQVKLQEILRGSVAGPSVFFLTRDFEGFQAVVDAASTQRRRRVSGGWR